MFSLGAVLDDQRIIVGLIAAALAGFIRGFSGFGSGMVYIPLVAAVYGPKVAAASIMLMDCVCTFPLGVRAIGRAEKKEVGLMVLGLCVGLPLGVQALLHLDPFILRWTLSILILAFLLLMGAGYSYTGGGSRVATLNVGLGAGILNGAIQMGGPVVVLYWMNRNSPRDVTRANLMLLFLIANIILLGVFLTLGIIDLELMAFTTVQLLPFGAAMLIGAHFYGTFAGVGYRYFVNIFIALVALVSMPLFDDLLFRFLNPAAP